MKTRSGVSAVVLAAGSSTRMGAIKQLLPLGNKTLLENALDNVRKAGLDEILLVLGASAEAIQREVPLDSIKVVVNDSYRQGMGTSLRTAISHVAPESDAIIVVLADQPFVRVETIHRLVSQYRERKVQIVVPLYQGVRGNPVLLDRSVFPELMSLSGDVGCRSIFESHASTTLKVAVDDPGILFDLDTPTDLDRIAVFSR